MADNPIKKLRESIDKGKAPRPPGKANHTLYLSEPQFRVFKNYCKFKAHSPSEVIDKLIAMYLEEVKDDLPMDPPRTD